MLAEITRQKNLTLPSDRQASGRTLGVEEIALRSDAIDPVNLTSTKRTFVKELEQKFADRLGVKHAYACASGSAAIHVAVAAIDPKPGDEIVTTSITDMGGLTPIVYQGAIPVFADVDPKTWNVTAETIEPCLSDRTKVIIVTHLFGNPCNMSEILELAKSRNIPVIEDCAQAYGAKHNHQNVGTFGDIGCFSLQQGKYITTGQGGLVVSNDDALARRMYLFINKAWGYGDPKPDRYFLTLNYRISELQAAVAVAQLNKLDGIIESRIATANKLTEKLQGVIGIKTPWVDPRNVHTYWKYCLRVDSQVIPNGPVELAQLLKEKGIFSTPRYIQKPAFMREVFQKQRTFGNSRYPLTLARPDQAVDSDRDRFSGTLAGLESILVLPWNECYTDDRVDYIASEIRQGMDVLIHCLVGWASRWEALTKTSEIALKF